MWIDRISAIEGNDSPTTGSDGREATIWTRRSPRAPTSSSSSSTTCPGRDCAALASNGELAADEIDRYKSEYIDPIVAIQSDPAYAGLRIVNVIEIDSLPNLVTNVTRRARPRSRTATR